MSFLNDAQRRYRSMRKLREETVASAMAVLTELQNPARAKGFPHPGLVDALREHTRVISELSACMNQLIDIHGVAVVVPERTSDE